MKILSKGIMPNGTKIQIEEWSESYKCIPYGSVIASYPKSKVTKSGAFAPKLNQTYRFSFNFNSESEAKEAFKELLSGSKKLCDFKENLDVKEYADCI